jgi:hypothetical protein
LEKLISKKKKWCIATKWQGDRNEYSILKKGKDKNKESQKQRIGK